MVPSLTKREGTTLNLILNSLPMRAPRADGAIGTSSVEDSINPAVLPTFDCLVLSGGGAKGAYGAGVAKALSAYRRLKEVRGPVCYIGASAGALNAVMVADGLARDVPRAPAEVQPL